MTHDEAALPAARVTAARRQEWRQLRWALYGVDAIVLALAVAGANLLRFSLESYLPVTVLNADRHVIASIIVVPLLLALFHIQGLYNVDHILSGTREYARIAHAATYGVLIAMAASYFGGGEALVSRSWLLLVWVLAIAGIGLDRFLVRRVVAALRRRGALRTRVVVVGASTFGVAIAEQLMAAHNQGLDVVGFLDEYIPLGQRLVGDVAVIGRPGDLANGRGLSMADEYVLVPQAIPFQRLEELTRLMVTRNEPVVRVAVSSLDLLTNGVAVAERGSVPLITLRSARITGIEAWFKRGLDLVGASLALLALAPFAAVAVARAYLAGARPIFRQQCLYVGGGEQTAVWLFDRRVSARLAIRGVPALLVVLRGQLSLVGPRPVECDNDAQYPSASLIAVKPGLTGPWRVSGAEATLADQATRDLTYVRNYTIWEDLRLIAESIRRMGSHQGADALVRWEERAIP